MSTTHISDEASLDESYPGAVTSFPEGMTEIVMAMIGVQSQSRTEAQDGAWTLISLLSGLTENRPVSYERAAYVDAAGLTNDIVVAYWTSAADYTQWWDSAAVKAWWNGLGLDPLRDPGVWMEVMTTTADRHQYATGSSSPAGPSRFLPLVPSDKFGFWGAYRARLEVSAHDSLTSPLEALPEPVTKDTVGRRLEVNLPDGICYIREGQTWDECGEEELQTWNTQMEPVIGDWVAALGDTPVATGCASIRNCLERDPESGEELQRQSQFAFLLSLSHIEQAARTNPIHLAVRQQFIHMYATASFKPKMNIWVEVHVPAPGGIAARYVNCHSGTGFLPFFEERGI